MKGKKIYVAIILAIMLVALPATSVFAQVDPSDPMYEYVGGVTLVGAIENLYDLGVLPVIMVVGVTWLGMIVYKRFRS